MLLTASRADFLTRLRGSPSMCQSLSVTRPHAFATADINKSQPTIKTQIDLVLGCVGCLDTIRHSDREEIYTIVRHTFVHI